MKDSPHPPERQAPLDIDPETFRKLGYGLVDRIAEHLGSIRGRAVTPGETPIEVRAVLGDKSRLPEDPMPADALLEEAANAVFGHSLLNGHPRFWGYITSSPATIGVLADFLAAAVNANVGAWRIAPMATEIEAQTIRWIAQFIGYPDDCGGLLVSGGNMANFVGFLAGRREQAGPDLRENGLEGAPASPFTVYTSAETHTWVHKAADLFGHGTKSIRWVQVNDRGEMDFAALRRQVANDRSSGARPFMVVGTAGSVSRGAVDPLDEIASFCQESGLWFHVDGAYGGLAVNVDGAPRSLAGLTKADSVAIDPHKWLYAPLEAGCVLVRKPRHLSNAFSYHPPYYNLEESAINYFDYGMQNSRGFRALKVWMALRQAGARAYRQMIGDDIRLSAHLYSLFDQHTEFEALSHSLSITTFRYVPSDLPARMGTTDRAEYLNTLNRDILARVESGGEAFVSNALIGDVFALRACIVNFRTSLADVEFLPELVARIGRDCDTRKH